MLAGAADLLLLFAGYLLTSVPGYALAGFAKDGPGTEAAMKYYLIGALHGVFMLAGITVLDLLMAIASRSALAVRFLLSYLAAYAVTNLGAFAVVTELRHASTLADYRGLARRHPGLAAVLVICLLSLVGTPPTCVFACKLEIFTATIDGGYTWLAALAVANTIASLFYYLRWLAPALLRQPAAAEPDPLRAAGHWAAAAAYTAGTISHALGIAVGAVLPLLTGTCCDDRGTAPGRCGGPAESGGYTVGNVADPEPVGGITGHQVADRSDAGGTIGDLVPCSTPPAEAGRADVPPNRRGRPLRLALLVMMAVILAGAVAVPAYLVTGHRQASGQPLRPSGIPPGHLDQPRRPDVAVAECRPSRHPASRSPTRTGTCSGCRTSAGRPWCWSSWTRTAWTSARSWPMSSPPPTTTSGRPPPRSCSRRSTSTRTTPALPPSPSSPVSTSSRPFPAGTSSPARCRSSRPSGAPTISRSRHADRTRTSSTAPTSISSTRQSGDAHSPSPRQTKDGQRRHGQSERAVNLNDGPDVRPDYIWIGDPDGGEGTGDQRQRRPMDRAHDPVVTGRRSPLPVHPHLHFDAAVIEVRRSIFANPALIAPHAAARLPANAWRRWAMPDDIRRPVVDKSHMPSRHVTVGPERAPHRAFLYSMGLSEEQINQPLVGVATTWNEAAPCNIALARQAQAAKKGVAAAHGTPREFTTITVTDGIAMGHAGMKASLISREIIADSVELTMRGHCYDALVGLAGCDKSLPGMMMAMVRLNVPSVFMYGGSIMPGRFRGHDVTIGDVYEWVGKHSIQ